MIVYRNTTCRAAVIVRNDHFGFSFGGNPEVDDIASGEGLGCLDAKPQDKVCVLSRETGLSWV